VFDVCLMRVFGVFQLCVCLFDVCLIRRVFDAYLNVFDDCVFDVC